MMPPVVSRILSGLAPSRRRLIPVIGAALVCHAGACDGGLTTSLGIEAHYAARAVGDAPLPAPIIRHESYERVLLADTLHFTMSGVARRVTVHRDTPVGGPSRVDTTRLTERFVIHGDSVRFVQDCPPNALCVGAPAGTFSSDRRQLLLQLWPGGPIVAFERIGPGA